LSGALVALLGRWGRKTGGSEGLLEALRAGKGKGKGKKKCGGVRGRLRWVGPCGGLHRGDWIVGDGGVWWVEWWGQNCVGVADDVGCRVEKVRQRCDGI
jgi:hypothetical protein